eukprot:CAMPEP_0196150598 /NCGR_PEP_ID=MMETSP0910-20130528/32023_1 /TAXON_ID=49265 /ORGANISM="Thalassiosira rotula, Strain GSO102" /LENGTH=30 /DNA_ID= /DNA_START= /DNA_END= /DNA_ORIENTATION=
MTDRGGGGIPSRTTLLPPCSSQSALLSTGE